MAGAVVGGILTAKTGFGHENWMWDWRWKDGNGTDFSPSTSVFPCQYHSTIAPYSHIHLPPTLYNVFLPAL